MKTGRAPLRRLAQRPQRRQFASAPASLTGWLPFTVPDFTLGTAGSFDFAPYAPPGAVGAVVATPSPALPSGISISGLQFLYSGGGAETSVAGILLDDVQAAEGDWISRSTGPGVMWAHDFRNKWEVHKFVYSNVSGGMDPAANKDVESAYISQIADGPTGFCMQQRIPAGANGNANPAWARPFAALPADTGYAVPAGMGTALPADRGYPDPANAPMWNPVSGGLTSAWTNLGYYGHSRYRPGGSQHQSFATWSGGEFWIQARHKFSSSNSNAPGFGNTGKFQYIDIIHGGSNQELNWQTSGRFPQRRGIDIYTNFSGSRNNSFLGSPQGTGGGNPSDLYFPGGDAPYGSTTVAYLANQSDPNYANNVWLFPYDEWFTLLWHVTPGIQAKGAGNDVDYSTPGGGSTGIEIYVHRQGETGYKKLWSKSDYFWSFDQNSGGGAFGWNGIKINGYMNGNLYPQEVTRRYTQIIFSTQFIAAPNDGFG